MPHPSLARLCETPLFTEERAEAPKGHMVKPRMKTPPSFFQPFVLSDTELPGSPMVYPAPRQSSDEEPLPPQPASPTRPSPACRAPGPTSAPGDRTRGACPVHSLQVPSCPRVPFGPSSVSPATWLPRPPSHIGHCALGLPSPDGRCLRLGGRPHPGHLLTRPGTRSPHIAAMTSTHRLCGPQQRAVPVPVPCRAMSRCPGGSPPRGDRSPGPCPSWGSAPRPCWLRSSRGKVDKKVPWAGSDLRPFSCVSLVQLLAAPALYRGLFGPDCFLAAAALLRGKTGLRAQAAT